MPLILGGTIKLEEILKQVSPNLKIIILRFFYRKHAEVDDLEVLKYSQT
jgi:hypothetical protein